MSSTSAKKCLLRRTRVPAAGPGCLPPTRDFARPLLRNVAEPLRYLSMDVWDSREDYEHFLREHREAYHELDLQCAGWTTRERHLSSFDAELKS